MFECRSNEDYAFAFRQWMNVGRKKEEGDRATAEEWSEMQQPWRVADPTDLKETTDIVHREQLWLSKPQLPFVPSLDLDADLSPIHRDTLGSSFLH